MAAKRSYPLGTSRYLFLFVWGGRRGLIHVIDNQQASFKHQKDIMPKDLDFHIPIRISDLLPLIWFTEASPPYGSSKKGGKRVMIKIINIEELPIIAP